jgi:hypothetical protein
MKSLAYNLNNAVNIIRYDGWIDFLKSMGHEILGIPCEEYYVYEHTIKEREPADFMASLTDFEEFILRDKREHDELVLKGYNFGFRKRNNRIALDNGAIVHCLFVHKELAHIGRIALTPRAKQYVDGHPFKVNFNQKEAVTGSTWSNPKFRGKGLMKYGYYKRFEFLRGLEYRISRNSVATTNTASNRVHEKFKPKIVAKARYRRILFFFEYWKEIPYIPD